MSFDSYHEVEFLKNLPIHYFTELLAAALCGCIVGLERELKRKAAGISTNAMICIGAALYMIFSELILTRIGITGADPTRIASQVIVGMGFIGAGTIIQARGRIVGLTSAATLWVVAGIGLVVGAGFPLLGLLITMFVVGLLYGVGKLEVVINGKCRFFSTQVSFRDDPKIWQNIREVFKAYDKNIEDGQWKKENDICFLDVSYCGVHPDHKEFIGDLLNIYDVRRTSR